MPPGHLRSLMSVSPVHYDPRFPKNVNGKSDTYTTSKACMYYITSTNQSRREKAGVIYG